MLCSLYIHLLHNIFSVFHGSDLDPHSPQFSSEKTRERVTLTQSSLLAVEPLRETDRQREGDFFLCVQTDSLDGAESLVKAKDEMKMGCRLFCAYIKDLTVSSKISADIQLLKLVMFPCILSKTVKL